MVVKTYRNDGVDYADGLGARPTTITAGAKWNLTIDKDKTLRGAVRAEKTVGIQVKNSSKAPISVKIDGSNLAAIYIPKKASESMVVEFAQDILITNEDAAETIATNDLVVTVTTGANQVTGAAGLGDIIVTSDFTGTPWRQQYTAADNDDHPLNGGVSLKLADVIIYVKTNNALFGLEGAHTFPIDAGSSMGFTKIDIGKLWVINAGAGANVVVEVLGVVV